MTVVPNLLLWVLVGFCAVVLLCLAVVASSLFSLRIAHRRLLRRHVKLAADVKHLALRTGRLRTGEQPTVRQKPSPPAPGTTPRTTGRHHRIG
jgi:hypothetical protein